MKRKDLLKHLEREGCALARPGRKHSLYINLADTSRTAAVPRHADLAPLFVLRLCRALDIATPKTSYLTPAPRTKREPSDRPRLF